MDTNGKQAEEGARVRALNRGEMAGGAIGAGVVGLPGRGGASSLRERVHQAMHEAERSMMRGARAQRLGELLDRHPEVAEMLELMREF